MTTRTLAFYEEKLRAHIMYNLASNLTMSLQDYMRNLIQDNRDDYKKINYAYLNVKSDLVGRKIY